MNCDNARANLSAYVEQELSEKDRREVSTHLGRCENCSRDLFAMQKAINLLRWVPRVDARPGFEDRLRLRLRTESAPQPRWAVFTDRLRGLGERFAAPNLSTLFGETLAATPASALFLALLFGTGGGALLMHQVMRNGAELAARDAATPEIMSAPNVTVATPASAKGAPVLPAPAPAERGVPVELVESTPAKVVPSAPAPAEETVQVAAAEAPAAETPAAPAGSALSAGRGDHRSAQSARRTQRPAAPILTASNQPGALRVGGARNLGSRVEVAPWATNQQPIEGPPAVSQVEYILDLVDVNQERMLQLPASAVVSGSTVTF
jgi:hypothetical protein